MNFSSDLNAGHYVNYVISREINLPDAFDASCIDFRPLRAAQHFHLLTKDAEARVS